MSDERLAYIRGLINEYRFKDDPNKYSIDFRFEDETLIPLLDRALLLNGDVDKALDEEPLYDTDLGNCFYTLFDLSGGESANVGEIYERLRGLLSDILSLR